MKFLKNKITIIVLSLIVVVSLVVVVATQCSRKPEQVYVYGTAQEPGSLNPNATDEPYGYSIYQNVYNRLVKGTNSFEIVPDLAKSWQFSDEGKKLTFNLEENVYWHDGEKFTASDVKFTFDTIINSNGYSAGNLSNVEEVTVVDDNTVAFTFETADASILSVLSGLGVFIMPEHIYENTDWLDNSANYNPVGTGPFKFKEWKSGESITLVKNDNYFGTEPKLEKVVFKFIPDENTAWLAWLNDEIDWYDSYPAAEVAKLKGNDRYTIVETLTSNVTYLSFNMTKAPFNDVRVRQAFAYAVDRNDLLVSAYQNVGKVAEYTIPSIYSNYTSDSAKQVSRNIQTAKDLLEDAGYTLNNDGYYLTIDFEYFDLDNNEELAQRLKSQLSQAGINLNLQLLEYSTWQDKVMNNKNYTLTIMSGNQKPTIFSTIARFNPESATNISGYDSSLISQYIDDAITSQNDNELKTAFNNIQTQLIADLPILNLIEKVEFVPLKSKVHGHALNDAYTYASADEMTYIYID